MSELLEFKSECVYHCGGRVYINGKDMTNELVCPEQVIDNLVSRDNMKKAIAHRYQMLEEERRRRISERAAEAAAFAAKVQAEALGEIVGN